MPETPTLDRPLDGHYKAYVCDGCGCVACDPEDCWVETTHLMCSSCDIPWPCPPARAAWDSLGLVPSFVVTSLSPEADPIRAVTSQATIHEVRYDEYAKKYIDVHGAMYHDIDVARAWLFAGGERGIEITDGRIVMHGIDVDDPMTDFITALRDYTKENRDA